MSIAITDDHRALADTAADFLRKRDSRGAARALLEAPDEPLPAVLGRDGRARLARPPRPRGARRLRLRPPRAGGRGRGARPGHRPGPVRPDGHRERGASRPPATTTSRPRCLPGLADGVGHRRASPSAASLDASTAARPRAHAGTVLGGGLADAARRRGRATTSWSSTCAATGVDRRDRPPTSTRPAASARVTLDGAPADVIPGGRQVLVDLARTLLAAEADGHRARVHRAWRPSTPRCASSSAARSRCSRRSSTTAPTCSSRPSSPPPRCGTPPAPPTTGGDQFTLHRRDRRRRSPCPAADLVRQPQHPGARRHRLHLGARRPPLPAPRDRARRRSLDAEAARRATLTGLARRGVTRERTVDLPPEAEPIRDEVRAFAESSQAASTRDAQQRTALIETGYAMPHWPAAVGPRRRRRRAARDRAGVRAPRASSGPRYGITGWVILTLIQHATEDQVAAVGAARARPGGHLVPAVQRARRRLRRRRRQDQGHAGRRRLAGQRPEGVDQRRAPAQLGLRDRAHQPRRAEARRASRRW